MSIIGNPIMAGVGASVPAASIFVTGLSETDTVTATKGSKTLTGKWVTKRKFGKVPLIPTMTGNSTPSGTASLVNGTTTETPAYLAFDGDDSTYAYSMSSSFPRGIQYKFDTAQTFTSVYIKWTPWTGSSLTVTCVLQTSMNGSTWTAHDTETISFSSTSDVFERTFELDNVTALYIRYVVTSISNSSTVGMPAFHTMQAYVEGEITVSGFEISPIRDFGTWTVTATDGTYTATQDVLVDVITEYEIEMDYKLWLYRDGDECENVTGGWIANNFEVTPTKNDDHLSLVSTGNLYSGGTFTTVNQIDITNFSYLKIEYIFSGTNKKSFFAVRTSQIVDNNTVETDIAKRVSVSITGSQTKVQDIMDVSDLTGSYFVELATRNHADAYSSTFNIYKVWLE